MEEGQEGCGGTTKAVDLKRSDHAGPHGHRENGVPFLALTQQHRLSCSTLNPNLNNTHNPFVVLLVIMAVYGVVSF